MTISFSWKVVGPSLAAHFLVLVSPFLLTAEFAANVSVLAPKLFLLALAL